MTIRKRIDDYKLVRESEMVNFLNNNKDYEPVCDEMQKIENNFVVRLKNLNDYEKRIEELEQRLEEYEYNNEEDGDSNCEEVGESEIEELERIAKELVDKVNEQQDIIKAKDKEIRKLERKSLR